MENKIKLHKRLVVIGGGAAGFFCAVNAARLNKSLEVIIVEKSSKLLSKVKISGGGRCNVTHGCFEIEEIIRRYPRGSNFLKKAFHQFFTTDTVKWFEQRGVPLKIEPDGRMFPLSDSSQSIADCLLNEAAKYRVKIILSKEVKKLSTDKGLFQIEYADHEKMDSDFVCIACGGYPKAAMFEWIKQLEHTIEDPVPSLFTFNIPGNSITQLMGVVAENTSIKIVGTKLKETGPLLITHWGLSGPAVLKLSAWGARQLSLINWKFTIQINWLANYNEQALQERFKQLRFEIAAQKMSTKNSFGIPARLWDFLLKHSGIKDETRWADLNLREQNLLIRNLYSFESTVEGKTTYKEEFVTAGGIQLNEVDANTMMSKKIPNLFFAGEILDVDGITGGYNFQHAWTSGFIAAKAIASAM
ncbi:MAG: NAD(P)/FAD-dependent oxidoreductase [Chitinophagaceae bacterium]